MRKKEFQSMSFFCIKDLQFQYVEMFSIKDDEKIYIARG